jgi:hypothetical protein
MLRQLGVDVKVQQELLRHADIRTTMNVYTQAVSEQKRSAQSSVVRLVLPLDNLETSKRLGILDIEESIVAYAQYERPET